jgi:hypothetical protein
VAVGEPVGVLQMHMGEPFARRHDEVIDRDRPWSQWALCAWPVSMESFTAALSKLRARSSRSRGEMSSQFSITSVTP